jgi:tRNA U34 2-thiouridine synthase MnmA/TrmU
VTENREDPLLYTQVFTVSNWHRINGDTASNIDTTERKRTCAIKIRYRQEIPTHWYILDNKEIWWLSLHLSEAQRAVAPGQFAVAYDNQTIIGSWIINQRIA